MLQYPHQWPPRTVKKGCSREQRDKHSIVALHFRLPPVYPPPPTLWLLEAPVRKIILQMHTPARTSQCWSRQTPAWTRSVHLDAPGQRHGQQPVSGTADPGVVKQDKSSRGSVDTTKTPLGPQRVRMSSGERPIGAAKGKQSDTEACANPPPPPSPPTSDLDQRPAHTKDMAPDAGVARYRTGTRGTRPPTPKPLRTASGFWWQKWPETPFGILGMSQPFISHWEIWRQSGSVRQDHWYTQYKTLHVFARPCRRADPSPPPPSTEALCKPQPPTLSKRPFDFIFLLIFWGQADVWGRCSRDLRSGTWIPSERRISDCVWGALPSPPFETREVCWISPSSPGTCHTIQCTGSLGRHARATPFVRVPHFVARAHTHTRLSACVLCVWPCHTGGVGVAMQ